jgi:putative colanic acid biosynthesis acetyltransferase WcaF
MNRKIDLSKFQSELSLRNKIVRVLWHVCYLLLFRPSPRLFFGWRRWLLRIFGSQLGKHVRIYPSAKIYYPPNLKMGDWSILADYVRCYNVDLIVIDEHAQVSPYCYLCSASHDHTKPNLPLITAPIHVETEAWVCAEVFIAPGIRIGRGAVVGARSSVFKDVPPWTVVGGNPARYIKDRKVDLPASDL